MDKLYENIKNERLNMNLTQQELAEAVGYKGKSMIAKIEKGQVNLSAGMIVKFSRVFNCSESYLMGLTEDKETIFDKSILPVEEYKNYYQNKEIDLITRNYLNASEDIKKAVCKLLDVDREYFAAKLGEY